MVFLEDPKGIHLRGEPIKQVGSKAWTPALTRAGIENF
jgi:hypothetical protein